MSGRSTASVLVGLTVYLSLPLYGWWVGGAAGLIVSSAALILLLRAAASFESGIYPGLGNALKWLLRLLVAHLALYALHRELAIEMLDFLERHIKVLATATRSVSLGQRLAILAIGTAVAAVACVVQRRCRS